MSRIIAEGKTKIVKTNPQDPGTVLLCFKDDITAGDGAKHDVIEGKAVLDWAEGERFDPVITQFHYKDDPLHDPMLADRYVEFMIRHKDAWEYAAMRDVNTQVFQVLEAAFAQFGVQLVDIKLEYGIIDGQLCVIDEISGGSFRLRPYRSEAPNLDLGNVLAELAPEQRLDKDTYRMGAAPDEVMSRFRAISALTARFKDVA